MASGRRCISVVDESTEEGRMSSIMDGYSEWAAKHGQEYLRRKYKRDRERAIERSKEIREIADRLFAPTETVEHGEDESGRSSVRSEHRLWEPGVVGSSPTAQTKRDGWPEGVSDGLTLPCGICGRRPSFDYTVDDGLWERVAPDHLKRSVICLPCFDELATEAGDSGDLLQVQFCGRGKTVVLRPESTYRYDIRGDRDDPPSRVNPDGEADGCNPVGTPERLKTRSGKPSGPRGEDDIVNRLRDEPRDDWLSDGSLRCNLCYREPCQCGVPTLFREATWTLRREAAAEIERLRARADGEDDIANEVYEVLKKVHAGEDPKRYTDYLLARLRRSAPREVGYVVLYEGSDLPTLVSCDVMTEDEAREVVRALQPESEGAYTVHPVGPPIEP